MVYIFDFDKMFYIMKIESFFNYLKGVHSSGTAESAKRHYGGLLIMSYIILIAFNYTSVDEMLYAGCALVAGGIAEKYIGNKKK